MDPFPVNRKGKAGFKVCAGKNGLSAFSKKGTEKIRMGALWLETGRCPGDFIFCADGDMYGPKVYQRYQMDHGGIVTESQDQP